MPSVKLPIKPLTPHELDEHIQRKIHRINKELQKGFDFIKSYDKSVTIFGSTRLKRSSPLYTKAVSLSEKLSRLGYAIVTGGGPGIMQAANEGAYKVGGKSLGLNIQLPREQVANPYQTDSAEFYYFFIRKLCLTFSAEAFIYFPGGYGTMDEFFEILTLVQTNKIRRVPIILFGSKFWQDFDDLFTKKMFKQFGTVNRKELKLYHVCDDENEVIRIIKKVPVVRGDLE